MSDSDKLGWLLVGVALGLTVGAICTSNETKASQLAKTADLVAKVAYKLI